jgi:hypothetical protein
LHKTIRQRLTKIDLEMQCMKHIVGGRAAKKATVLVSNTGGGG